MRAQCPQCKTCSQIDYEQISEWAPSGGTLISCNKCGTVYYATIATEAAHDGVNFTPAKLTRLAVGAIITLSYEKHELYNKQGKIIAVDHCNYRIEFDGGFKLWIPHHWVKV